MKAIQSIRQFLPGIIFTAALMAVSFDGNAQNNRKYNKSDKNRDRKEYRNDHSSSSHNSEDRNDDLHGDRKHFREYNHGRNDDGYQYSQHYSNYGRQQYYNHPQYGRVYQRFDDQPVVFRHSHGDYYYHGNQFYTYRDGVGYCPTEYPRDTYFRDLPFDCNRVHVNGQVFFRHGDLYFSHSSRGYVIVPSPLEINFSLRF